MPNFFIRKDIKCSFCVFIAFSFPLSQFFKSTIQEQTLRNNRKKTNQATMTKSTGGPSTTTSKQAAKKAMNKLNSKFKKNSTVESPNKSRIRLKREDITSVSFGDKDVILTETIGMGDMIVLHIEKSKSKIAGFIHPLAKESFNKNSIEFNEQNFNCHSNNKHLFLRRSHELDVKVPVGKASANGVMYNKTAILCEPNISMLDDNGCCTVELEKKFRDVCFSVLAEANNRDPTEQFAEWTSSHSLTAKTLAETGKCKSLDMIFVDETVGNILHECFIPSHIPKEEVHEFLTKHKIKNIFTRKKNGKCSAFAISEFNFPSDTIPKKDDDKAN